MSKYVVFDLDGTLVDPGQGICQSFNAALEDSHFPVADEQWIRRQIGMPLPSMFRAHLQEAASAQIEILVNHYRRVYLSTGFSLCELYAGAKELLELLSERCELGICTSKRSDIADKILVENRIRSLFSFVSGGDLSKAEQLGRLLDSGQIDSTAIMVGDRAEDITGANRNGLETIGVMWGFGSYTELSGAGPGVIVQNIDELRRWLLAQLFG